MVIFPSMLLTSQRFIYENAKGVPINCITEQNLPSWLSLLLSKVLHHNISHPSDAPPPPALWSCSPISTEK